MFPIAVHDMLIANYHISIDHIYLLPYVVPDLFLICLYVMGRRYIDAQVVAERSHIIIAERLREQEYVLRDSYDRLRSIEQREILVGERQRLMRDMHDGLGSTLTGAIHLANGGAAHTAIAQMLRDSLDDLKLTIDSLEPVDADLLLLLATLRFRFAPRLQAQGITLEWAVTPLPALHWLTPTSALHILRLLQEILTNILKHACASCIRISTEAESCGVMVYVDDDGIGLLPIDPAAGGRGLRNIRWRAELLFGQVTWQARQKGVRFTLWLPIRLSSQAQAEHPAVEVMPTSA